MFWASSPRTRLRVPYLVRSGLNTFSSISSSFHFLLEKSPLVTLMPFHNIPLVSTILRIFWPKPPWANAWLYKTFTSHKVSHSSNFSPNTLGNALIISSSLLIMTFLVLSVYCNASREAEISKSPIAKSITTPDEIKSDFSSCQFKFKAE